MPLVSRRASPSDGFRAFSHRQWLSFNRGARNTANVRFGSLADIPPHADDVRSTPQKADIAPRIRDVSFLPEAEIVLLRKQTMSLS